MLMPDAAAVAAPHSEVRQAPPYTKHAAPEVMFERPALHWSVPVAWLARQTIGFGKLVRCYRPIATHLIENATQIAIRVFERPQRITFPGRPRLAPVFQ
jgi:hypothetical protein